MKRAFTLIILAAVAALLLVSCGKGDIQYSKYNYDLSEYIKLADYKNLPVEGYNYQVTDEALQNQILTTRAYYSKTTTIEDRGAELGDIVYINYNTIVEGEEIEGGSETDCELTLGTGTFIEEFESALVGSRAGDHVTVNAVFPSPYAAYPELSGKNVTFEIDVTEVRMQELPDYNDDFVRFYFGCDSTAEFEEMVRKKLEENYEAIYLQYLVSQTWNPVFENTEVIKYPEAEVKDMYDSLVEKNQSYASSLGILFNTYCQIYLSMTEEEFYEYAETESKNTIKEEMICFAIARAENITVSSEEYKKRGTEYAVQNYGLDTLDELEELYDKETINQGVLCDIVKEYIADNAQVTIIE